MLSAGTRVGPYEILSAMTPRVPVSSNGGRHPKWRRDGRELFFRRGNGFNAAGVSFAPTFRVDRSQPLFVGPYQAEYDVAADGSRFLALTGSAAEDTVDQTSGVNVVTNWLDDLKRRIADHREQPGDTHEIASDDVTRAADTGDEAADTRAMFADSAEMSADTSAHASDITELTAHDADRFSDSAERSADTSAESADDVAIGAATSDEGHDGPLPSAHHAKPRGRKVRVERERDADSTLCHQHKAHGINRRQLVQVDALERRPRLLEIFRSDGQDLEARNRPQRILPCERYFARCVAVEEGECLQHHRRGRLHPYAVALELLPRGSRSRVQGITRQRESNPRSGVDEDLITNAHEIARRNRLRLVVDVIVFDRRADLARAHLASGDRAAAARAYRELLTTGRDRFVAPLEPRFVLARARAGAGGQGGIDRQVRTLLEVVGARRRRSTGTGRSATECGRPLARTYISPAIDDADIWRASLE